MYGTIKIFVMGDWNIQYRAPDTDLITYTACLDWTPPFNLFTHLLQLYLGRTIILNAGSHFRKQQGTFFATVTKLHHFTMLHNPSVKFPFSAILSLKLVNTLPGLNTAPILNFLTGIFRTTRLSIIKPVISALRAGSRPHREKCWTLTPDLLAHTQRYGGSAVLTMWPWPPHVFHMVIARQFTVNYTQ